MRLTPLDGKLPNMAMMKLAHYHKSEGDEVMRAEHCRRFLWPHLSDSATWETIETLLAQFELEHSR